MSGAVELLDEPGVVLPEAAEPTDGSTDVPSDGGGAVGGEPRGTESPAPAVLGFTCPSALSTTSVLPALLELGITELPAELGWLSMRMDLPAWREIRPSNHSTTHSPGPTDDMTFPFTLAFRGRPVVDWEGS